MLPSDSLCQTSIFYREAPGGCFTNVSRALQNILSIFVCCRNRTSYENFQLKLCSCAQSHALGTRTKFQFEIMTLNMITGIVYFREIILESSRNVSETIPGLATGCHRDVRRGGLSSCFCMLLHFLEISCKRQLGMSFWQNGKHMVSLFFILSVHVYLYMAWYVAIWLYLFFAIFFRLT